MIIVYIAIATLLVLGGVGCYLACRIGAEEAKALRDIYKGGG